MAYSGVVEAVGSGVTGVAVGDEVCGMTGARIMTTLLNDLETDDKTIGIETMCVAGGQGQAMVIERLN